MRYMLLFIYYTIRSLIIILIGLISLFIVYPLGVILPFLWNFTWNPRGWVFNRMRFIDSLDLLSFLFGISEKRRYEFVYEYYETYFHFLLAMLFLDTKYVMDINETYKIINEEIKKELGIIEEQITG